MPGLATKGFPLPKLLTIVAVGLLLAGVLYYVLFQARFLIGGPSVVLADIPPVVQTVREVPLSGTASNITAIYLQGRPIVTNEDGQFNETVILEEGYNIVRIDVHDRYGRSAYVEQAFVYTPIPH
ncbi:MAG: hypothetical protein R3B69_03230 [Candidatus Paceibacterota bacterium]